MLSGYMSQGRLFMVTELCPDMDEKDAINIDEGVFNYLIIRAVRPEDIPSAVLKILVDRYPDERIERLKAVDFEVEELLPSGEPGKVWEADL